MSPPIGEDLWRLPHTLSSSVLKRPTARLRRLKSRESRDRKTMHQPRSRRRPKFNSVEEYLGLLDPTATPPSRCTRRTPYLLRSTLQRVQAESLLPGVPRRALQVAQSSESEALFQLGALQTTAATPAASKAAARTRSHRRDLRTPYRRARRLDHRHGSRRRQQGR